MVEATSGSLRAREKAIADQFIGGVSWIMVAWPLVNTTVWVALWPLDLTGMLPLWAGFLSAIARCPASHLRARTFALALGERGDRLVRADPVVCAA